jgi:hypothetical protein
MEFQGRGEIEMIISTKHIETISRAELWGQEIYAPNKRAIDIPAPADIMMYRVRAISMMWEAPETWLESWRLLATDTATGFHGTCSAMYFAILGTAQGIEVLIGMEASGAKADPVQALITSAYPGTELEKLSGDQLEQVCKNIERLKFQATVVGSPVVKVGSEGVGVEQLERVIRGMRGRNWALVVVARPLATQKSGALLQTVINELRVVSDFETSSGADKPLVKEYESGLDALQKKLVCGQGSGVWNAGVNIFCDDPMALKTAKALIKGVLGGEKSYPDPIQAIEIDQSKFAFPAFGFINEPAPQGPGKFQYEYRFASLVNSEELTAYARLPLEEQPGYHVFRSASFDVYPHSDPSEKDAIELGNVVDRQADTGIPYRISINDLNRHALVVGNTGSGKTNTVFHLLGQLYGRIPFLVIEPVKREYRQLSGQYKDLRVFTLGNEMASPIRLNPFEVLPGIPVLTQIDHIKSIFFASFVLYAPMPHVLERCIHEIYTDKGWNLTRNENLRGKHPYANPTLTDLYNKIDDVVVTLKYEERLQMDISAALKTRINSLRIGSKGAMLDTVRSTPIAELMRVPTVLELESVSDDDEKAFLMGLIMTRIYTYHVAQRAASSIPEGLNHLTVVEEAHRLLADVPRQTDADVANTRGKAVDTFCNILAEIRAYGEGLLIVDQIPTKLAPEVIKHTSLKVMHRLGAMDDQAVMSATMNLDERQTRHVATLDTGVAAVFGLGDDAPMLVRVPRCRLDKVDVKDADLASRHQKFALEWRAAYRPYEQCDESCPNGCIYRGEADRIIEAEEISIAFGRLPISAINSAQPALDEIRNVVGAVLRTAQNQKDINALASCTLLQLSERYSVDLGQWHHASFVEVENLAVRLAEFTLGLVATYDPNPQNAREQQNKLNGRADAFRDAFLKVVSFRGVLPYPDCGRFCQGVCIYGYNIWRYHYSEAVKQAVVNAMSDLEHGRAKKLANLCQRQSKKALSSGISDPERICVAGCFLLQHIDRFRQTKPELYIKALDQMMGLFRSLIERSNEGGNS